MLENEENNTMPKITISISQDSKTKLKQLAEKHFRSLSKEVEYLIQSAPEE